MKDNILAKIARKEVSANIFYEDSEFLAILDVRPIVEGHSLIIPKRPAKTVFDLDEKQMSTLGEALYKVSEILKKKYGENIAIVNTSGEEASQAVPYLHFHLIPRNKKDRLWDGDKSKIVYDTSSGFERLTLPREELAKLVEELKSLR